MRKISNCRVCQSKKIHPFFDLGKQPLANSLLKKANQKEKKYPLSLSWCKDCNLVQLNHTVDPKELFSNYVWVTGTSKTAKEYAKIFYNEMVSRFKSNDAENYVLEIASNDGTFLKPFIENKYKTLGVDPAENIVKVALKEGVPTEHMFFGVKAARKLLKGHGPAAVVFARNVLPHVANTRDFIEGMKIVLKDDGVGAVEVHYADKILKELHYDSIYHEHLCYFTVKSLEKLLNDFDLYIFDIIKSPISGGSIVVYFKKKKTREKVVVNQYRDKETIDKINNFSSWKNFARKSYFHRDKLIAIIKKINQDKKKIVGYGASARSSTLLNFCGINSKMISAIADQNHLKQNLFTAGSHILIEKPEKVIKRNPDYILILAWNFNQEIIENLENNLSFRGSYIIPLPNEPKIKFGCGK
ncbi:MAG: putative SnoG [Parcubacteria group bacterium Athens0714_26]|nr:MAG: putative SnoG [Parcubacteria group bacterium Athens1014_26]TSD03016.1 MAG: putative SnoG [Parcubacteria group bacterium Athens0714_26]